MNSFREWLNTLFGSDGGRAVQMLFALLLVVLLILAVTWLFRRLFGATLHRGRSQRLSVVDSTAIDQHRRLVLLRRDEVEHLVMVGGPNDVLVESRILKAPPVLAGRAAARVPAGENPTGAPSPAQMSTARQPVVPAAAPEPPISPLTEASPPGIGAVRAKAAAGAASVAAAVASAGALLRARIGRAEEGAPTPAPVPPPAGERERLTLDDVFGTPLGRVAEPARVDEPPPRPTQPLPPAPEPMAPRLDEPRGPTFAFEPSRPPEPNPDRFADGLARALSEPPPAPRRATPPPTPAAPPRDIEIDLLADLEAIGSEIARNAPSRVEPPAAVETESAAVAASEIVPSEDVPVSAPEPVLEVTAREFDFDFDFTDRPQPAAEPVAVPRVDPTFETARVAEEVVETTEEEPEAEAESAIEIIRTPEEPAAVAPEPVAPASPPKSSVAATVDELEEEMARLLAELSGQSRR